MDFCFCNKISCFIAFCLVHFLSNASILRAADRPNIVYIFADDMGWGTGQFNNPNSAIDTPNLNQLASDGLNFTRHYSATVCSPSRGMMMTGFHSGNTSNDRNNNIGQGLLAEEVTVAEILKETGYQTSVFGKWGWGGTSDGGVLRPNATVNNATTLPQNKGFDEFYGYLSHGRAHSYQVDSLWTTEEPSDDNNNGIDEVGEKYQTNQDSGLWLEKTGNNPANNLTNYTHDLVGIKSEEYIRDHAGDSEPFYMQVNYTIPHFDLDAISGTSPLTNLKGETIFAGGLAQYASNSTMTTKEKKHAAMISRMDASIGSLINRLEDPNGDGDTSDSVLDNTLILFSSDNGPTPEDGLTAAGITNLDLAGNLRGGKRDLFEGGIRTPLLVRWDSQIEANRRGTSDSTLTDLADFMATAAEISNARTPVGIDGISIAPLIQGTGEQRAGKVVLSENFENSQTGNTTAAWSIIRGDHKLIKFRNGTLGLYNVTNDPSESSPIDTSVPANLALRNELEEIALAEGAGRADSYYVRYANWTGSAGDGSFTNQVNWSVSGGPDTNWSTVVNNQAVADQIIQVDSTLSLLGLEVSGDSGGTILEVLPGKQLTARNQVRVESGGRIEIAAASVSTARWFDVEQGGKISGQGAIEGVVYNKGTIAPGREEALPEVNNTPDPLEEISDYDLNTSLIPLIVFDFTGIQDDSPLTQTSTLDENINIVEGFNFGPATSPRNAGNVGDEFNVQGFSIGTTLASALSGDHYLTFTIDPGNGSGTILDEIQIDLWRNGFNASENYALFTSVDGFTESDVLSQYSFPENQSGIGQTQSLFASPLTSDPHKGPIEIRVYGWGSNNAAGNTHFNHVSVTGTVLAIPTFVFDFSSVQDTDNLTVRTQDSTNRVDVVQGVSLGSGLSFSNTNDSGDEFNVSSWSTQSTRQEAQSTNDFLTFTVKAIEGLAMAIDSVTFDLWRESASSPTDFAIMSSLAGLGFADLDAGQGTIIDIGQANSDRIVGLFDSSIATQDPIEFRLYGWNALNSGGNVHVNKVSFRAVFQTMFDVDLDPTGILAIDGDLHHNEGGLIDLEVGGTSGADPSNTEFDRLIVNGLVSLAGDVQFTLVDGYVPQLGDKIEIISANAVEGQFAVVQVSNMPNSLAFKLIYGSNKVEAVVTNLLEGDFNADGNVNAADYTMWRDTNGQRVDPYTGADADGNGLIDLNDYQIWVANYGADLSTIAVSLSIPEPTSASMFLGVTTQLVVMQGRWR